MCKPVITIMSSSGKRLTSQEEAEADRVFEDLQRWRHQRASAQKALKELDEIKRNGLSGPSTKQQHKKNKDKVMMLRSGLNTNAFDTPQGTKTLRLATRDNIPELSTYAFESNNTSKEGSNDDLVITDEKMCTGLLTQRSPDVTYHYGLFTCSDLQKELEKETYFDCEFKSDVYSSDDTHELIVRARDTVKRVDVDRKNYILTFRKHHKTYQFDIASALFNSRIID